MGGDPAAVSPASLSESGGSSAAAESPPVTSDGDACSAPHSGPRLYPSFPDRNIPIFLSCDDKYFPHTLTAIASILHNGDSRNNYDFTVITDAVAPAKLSIASEWIASNYPNASLRYIDIGDYPDIFAVDGLHVTRNFPRAVYFRFFAPTLFEGYDKVIYLDSDLIVLADIADLYNIDLGNNFLAGASDIMFEEKLKLPDGAGRGNAIGFHAGDRYFNTGVLLLNLRQMRIDGIESSLMEAARRLERLPLPDQDVFNYVCKGRAFFLDHSWNMQEWMIEDKEHSVKQYISSESIRAICQESRNNTKILHFAEKKPWNFPYTGTLSEQYWKYSRLTPLHQAALAKLRRHSGPFAKLVYIGYSSLNIFWWGLSWPLAKASRKERIARRLFEHRLALKSVLRSIGKKPGTP